MKNKALAITRIQEANDDISQFDYDDHVERRRAAVLRVIKRIA